MSGTTGRKFLGLHPFFAPKNGWNIRHKSYFVAASFFICLRRVLPGRGQLWRQSCTNRSPERHSLINCRVQPERANSSLRCLEIGRSGKAWFPLARALGSALPRTACPSDFAPQTVPAFNSYTARRSFASDLAYLHAKPDI